MPPFSVNWFGRVKVRREEGINLRCRYLARKRGIEIRSSSDCNYSSGRSRQSASARGARDCHLSVSGISGCLFRNQLQHHALVRAGDFFYVPAGTPHLPYNASADEPYVAVIARTEPNGQESVTMRPDLDELADWSTITLLRR
jgi:hypothetical protein